ELDLLLVAERLGRGVLGETLELHAAALAVAGRVQEHAPPLAVAGAHDRLVGEVLDRVDHLAVPPDERLQAGAVDHRDDAALSVLLDAHRAFEAEPVEDRPEQALHGDRGVAHRRFLGGRRRCACAGRPGCRDRWPPPCGAGLGVSRAGGAPFGACSASGASTGWGASRASGASTGSWASTGSCVSTRPEDRPSAPVAAAPSPATGAPFGRFLCCLGCRCWPG